jgi:hypothetical protein
MRVEGGAALTPVQHGLFDASRTTTTKCAVCGELREPNEDTVRHCPTDGLRREGDVSPRPVGCLNAYQPEYAEIPY